MASSFNLCLGAPFCLNYSPRSEAFYWSFLQYCLCPLCPPEQPHIVISSASTVRFTELSIFLTVRESRWGLQNVYEGVGCLKFGLSTWKGFTRELKFVSKAAFHILEKVAMPQRTIFIKKTKQKATSHCTPFKSASLACEDQQIRVGE
jgi:hypothetical protein